MDKAVCFFHNINGDNNDIAGVELPNTLEINVLKKKAQNLLQTALTTVYQEAQNEARSKKDKDDSKTTSKP